MEFVLFYVNGHEEKSSLAFVIDRTSSMEKEINQVKITTDKVFNNVINSKTNHIDNFVLVTFDDPKVQVCTVTRNAEEFKNALNKIELVTGGYCPEASMSGIQQALEITHPNSFIYVFTDASANDYTKMEVVKSLSQKKSTQVNFLLTGRCRFQSSEKYFVVYDKLAEATSGHVFNIEKDDVAKVIDFVANSLKSKITVLKRKKFVDKFDQKVQFTIDSKISDIHGLTKSKEKITRVTITTIEHPNPDIVKIEETNHVPPQVSILGDSHVKLEFDDVISIKCQVRANPKPNITWMDNDGNFFESKVTDLDSPKYLSILNITKADKNTTLTCKAKNEEGYDEKSVVLEVKQNMFLNIFEYPKDIKIEYKKSKELKCKIDAYPPAQISWYRNNKKLSNNEDLEITPDNITLRIKQMQPYLKGKYYVEISNKFKTEKILFNVFIVGAEPPIINKTIATYFPIKGSDLDIYCSIIKGKPEPVISWSYKKNYSSTEFENLDTERDNVLHLKQVEIEHSGVYRCIAKNDLAYDKFEIEVVVEYAPVITKSNPRVSFKIGEKATLPCEVSATPRATVHCFTVSINDKGDYSCRAQNKIGVTKRTIKVFPFMSPTIDPPDSSNITLRTGEQLKLTCKAHGLPEPKIKWLYNSFDKEMMSVNKSVNSIYEIKVQLYDAGEYVCVAGNSGGQSQMSIFVHIAAAPQFKPMTNILEGVVGDLVLYVPCDTLNVPVPTISWEYKTNDRTKGKTIISEGMGEYIINSSNTLILKKITKNSEGLYKCIAKNAYGSASHEYEIQIRDFPYPRTEDVMKTTTYIERSTGTLNCPDISVYGEHYTRWYKDGHIIKNCTDTPCTLKLFNMTKADSGVYSCRVSKMNGSNSTHMKIIVGIKPYFRVKVKKYIPFEENGDVSLDCNAYGEPVPTIIWFKASKKILEKNTHFNFKMTSDCIGKYECIVSNIFGSINRIFEIQSDLVCQMNMTFNRNMPLFLEPNSSWILTDKKTINTEIKIDCLNEYISDGERKFISPLWAKCIGKTIFKTDFGNIDISKLKCDRPINIKIQGTNERCIKGNSELVQVGFEVKTSFISVYDVCIDKIKNYPCFIKYALNENMANSIPTELVHYVKSPYMPFIFEDLYDCSNQLKSIYAKTGVNLSEGNKCCFTRKQLVSPKDMLPGIAQIATYTYVNVIPQWSTCGTENWDEVERRIRFLAASRSTLLEVWTGTSESIKLPNQKIDTFVTINDRYDRIQRVPRFIWKLVIYRQNPRERGNEEGLAIVVMNTPNLEVTEALKQIPCKRDICNKTKWMYGSQWHDPSKGFVFCCNVKEFMTAFHYDNLFPFMKPLK
ncbi:unnamed protein product, partial [Brenthis ino]